MKRLITLIALVAVALTPVGAFASPGDPEAVAYVTPDGANVLLLMRVETEDRATARFMVSMLDDATLEDTLSLIVIESDELDRDARRGIGADRATLFAVYEPDMGPGLVLVASDGPDVFVLAAFGDDLDGAAFAELTVDAIANDLDIDTPRGYIAVPLDDEPAFSTSSL